MQCFLVLTQSVCLFFMLFKYQKVHFIKQEILITIIQQKFNNLEQ